MMMKRIILLTTFLLLSVFMIGQNTAISYDNIRTDNIRSYRTNLTKMWNDVLCNKNLTVTDTLFANTFTPYSGGTQTFTGNVTLGDAAGDKLYIEGDSIYVWNDTITGDIEPEYMSGNIANETVTIDTVYSKCFSNGSWTECLYTVALDSAETWNFPITSKTVQFDIFVNGGNEHVIGTVTTAGVVLIGLGYGTVTWDDADTGGDYCIIDGGDYGILKNRVSGAKKTFFVKLKYNL